MSSVRIEMFVSLIMATVARHPPRNPSSWTCAAGCQAACRAGGAPSCCVVCRALCCPCSWRIIKKLRASPSRSLTRSPGHPCRTPGFSRPASGLSQVQRSAEWTDPTGPIVLLARTQPKCSISRRENYMPHWIILNTG